MQSETATLPTASTENDRHKFLVAALNGTALYVLAYYVVWGVHQLAKVGLSQGYSLRGNWDPTRVVYTMADSEWWPLAIIAVYGVGPLVCLLLGIVAFVMFWKRQRAHRGQLKLLLLWVAFHSCNAVFGAMLADTFTQSGFWYVPDWLFRMGNVANAVVGILFGLVQLAAGYFGSIAFLQAHDSRTVMRYANRRYMVAFTLVVPWVAGSVFITLTKLPYFSLQELLHLFMMGLLVTPMALGCLNETFSDTVRRPLPTHVSWGLVGLAVLLAVTWRLALSPPVAFG